MTYPVLGKVVSVRDGEFQAASIRVGSGRLLVITATYHLLDALSGEKWMERL